jgi:acetylornithine/succinyldiaminopimelate/putrescine aminotransferase
LDRIHSNLAILRSRLKKTFSANQQYHQLLQNIEEWIHNFEASFFSNKGAEAIAKNLAGNHSYAVHINQRNFEIFL